MSILRARSRGSWGRAALAIGLAAVVAVLAAHRAFARSLTRLGYRVDLAAGTASALPRDTAVTHPAPSAPRCATPASTVHLRGGALWLGAGSDPSTPSFPIGADDPRNDLSWTYEDVGVILAGGLMFTPGRPNTSATGWLVGVDRSAGRVAWRRETGGELPQCFVIEPGLVALAASDRFEVVSAATGRAAWTPLRVPGVPVSLVPLDGSQWLLHTDAQLAAIDVASGRVRWSVPARRSPGPLVVGGTVLALEAAPGAPTVLRIIDGTTGHARPVTLMPSSPPYDRVSWSLGAHDANTIDLEVTLVVLD